MRKIYKFVLSTITAISLVLSMTSCSAGHDDYQGAGILMGTYFSSNFRSVGVGTGEKVWSELVDLGEALEEDTLSWRVEGSEVCSINEAKDKSHIKLSDNLAGYLYLCQEVSEKSDGAFDITIGELTKLWNIDEAAMWQTSSDQQLSPNAPSASDTPEVSIVPSKADIEEKLAVSGYDKLILKDGFISILDGMSLDLGAIGKGIYLDEVYRTSKGKIEYGVISAGGSILTIGSREGSPWKIGIVDPFDTSKTLVKLKLDGDNFISTSGDYERFFYKDGKKYHHILDPRTGYPAESGLKSVTVIIKVNLERPAYESSYQLAHDNAYDNTYENTYYGTLTDALSTAIFVLGEEKGIELAREYDAQIILVRTDGTIYYSEDVMEEIVND